MRVIVTGAASFIGSAVVRRLLDEGNYVCAVVRPGSESTKRFKKILSQDYPDEIVSDIPAITDSGSQILRSSVAGNSSQFCDVSAAKVQVVELDLQSIEKLPEIMDSYWDVFLHAGWEGAGSANREKEDVQQSNITQTIAALKTAAALGCRRFVFTGSQAEYGMVKGPANENTPTNPVSPYGRAKVAVSKQAVPLSKELGIEYMHARLYSVYGPGDHEWSLINSCLASWKNHRIIELGPCTQYWNFLYVDDAAKALCTLLSEGKPEFYNIAGNDTRPLSNYIKEMAHICSAEGLYVFTDRPQNAEGAADLIPDISKIEKETSWRPKTSFEEGIKQLWEMED